MKDRKSGPLSTQSVAKQLLLGCGSTVWCGCSHPSESFVTVDINPNYKPEILCDATDLSALQKHLQGRAFASVIYEYFPFPHFLRDSRSNNLLRLSDHVVPDGYIVHMMSAIAHLQEIPDDQVIWMAGKKASNVAIFLMSPHADQERLDMPQLNPVLRGYLGNFLDEAKPEQVFHRVRISKDFKRFHENLMLAMESFERTEKHTGYKILDAHALRALMQFKNLAAASAPIKVSALKQLLDSYQPGFFRKHFTGVTQGMQELTTAIKKIAATKDVLDVEDAKTILKIIIERQARLTANKNPSRSGLGETARIFDEVATMLVTFTAGSYPSNKDKYDKKMDSPGPIR